MPIFGIGAPVFGAVKRNAFADIRLTLRPRSKQLVCPTLEHIQNKCKALLQFFGPGQNCPAMFTLYPFQESVLEKARDMGHSVMGLRYLYVQLASWQAPTMARRPAAGFASRAS